MAPCGTIAVIDDRQRGKDNGHKVGSEQNDCCAVHNELGQLMVSLDGERMGKQGGPHGRTSLPHVLGGATYHLRQALPIQRAGVVGGGAVDLVHGVQRACAAPVAVSVHGRRRRQW